MMTEKARVYTSYGGLVLGVSERLERLVCVLVDSLTIAILVLAARLVGAVVCHHMLAIDADHRHPACSSLHLLL